MDLVIRREILNNKLLKSREKMVLATLELIFKLDGKTCVEGFVNQKLISFVSGLPAMAVKCALATLCRLQIIDIIHNQTNIYEETEDEYIYEEIKSIPHKEQFFIRVIGG